jgi:hypothetical protein
MLFLIFAVGVVTWACVFGFDKWASLLDLDVRDAGYFVEVADLEDHSV